MKLFELFNTRVPYKKLKKYSDYDDDADHEGYSEFHFTIDDKVFRVYIEDFNLEAYVEFSLVKDGLSKWNITGESPRDAAKIIGAVNNVVKDYVEDNPHIKYISFTAKEPSRIKLYNAIAKKLDNNFKILQEPNGDTKFVITV
jgi:hypothetical protein